MTVKIVSDISQGYYADGTRTSMAYCFRVIGPESSSRGKNKVHTYTGELPETYGNTGWGEAAALERGVNTALNLYPNASQLVCFSDCHAFLHGIKGKPAQVRGKIKEQVKKNGKLVLFRDAKEIRDHYLICHREAKAYMKKQKSPLTTYCEEAYSREEHDKNPTIVDVNTIGCPPEKKSSPIIARIKKFLNIFVE